MVFLGIVLDITAKKQNKVEPVEKPVEEIKMSLLDNGNQLFDLQNFTPNSSVGR